MKWETDSTLIEMVSKARSARDVFLNDLEYLPKACQTVVRKQYKARLKDRGGAPLLGECAPWFLSDILAVNEPNKIEKILKPWMELYFHTLLLDDIIDNNDHRTAAPAIIASSLIAERGIRRLHEIFPNNSWILLKLDECFLDMAFAAIDEIGNHRNTLQNYTEKDIAKIGKKFSILDFCGAMLLADSKNKIPLDSFLFPISLLSNGMQLLDDITDWYDDWQIRNYTPLLTEAFQFMNVSTNEIIRYKNILSRNQILAAIILSGSLENCLTKSERFLSEMILHATLETPSVTSRFFSLLLSEVSNFKNMAAISRKILSQEHHSNGFLRPELYVPNEESIYWISKIDSGIKIIAQGC